MTWSRTESVGRRVVLALCGMCFLVWLAQWWSQRLPAPDGVGGLSFSEALRNLFGLDATAVRRGALWQPLTYAFLHGSWAHLAANLFGLGLTGYALTNAVGARRFLWLFVLGAAAGAIGFLLSAAFDPRLPAGTVCVGASAAVAACIGAATSLAPRRRVTLWVTVFPIPLRAGWLFPLFLIFFLCEAWLWPTATAYGAHFGGWVAGLLFGLLCRHAETNALPLVDRNIPNK